MKKIQLLILLSFLLFSALHLTAQFHDKMEGGGEPDPQLSQEDNDYLDRQAEVFLDTVLSILSEYPAEIKEVRERGFAKLLLDAVFHEHFAAFRKPVQQFYHTRIDDVIQDHL